MSFLDKAQPVKQSPSFLGKAQPASSPVAQPRKKSFMQKSEDIVTKIFPGQKVGESIGTLGGFLYTGAKEKLGLAPKGATKAYDLSAPTPLQTVGDVAKGAAMIYGAKLPAPGGTTALAKIGHSAVQGAGIGLLAGGGDAATKTSDNAIPTLQDGINVAKGSLKGAATGAAVSAAVTGIGQLLSKAGDKIMNSVIKPQKVDIDDGFSIDTVKKYKLGGSLKQTLEKTESTMDDISRELNAKLVSSNKTINLNDVYAKTSKELSGNKLKSFGANSNMGNALKHLENELMALDNLDNLPITDAQIVKQASGHYGAWTYGIPDPDANARQKVYNAFYRQLKNAIEDNTDEGVRALNHKLSELIPVKNAIIRRIPVAERNNILSLYDIITLTASAVDPKALGSFALSLASKSGRVGNALSAGGQNISRIAAPLGGLFGLAASQPNQKTQSQ